MKLDAITNKVKGIFLALASYRYFLIGATIVILFGYTVWRIDYLSGTQKDEVAYQEQLATVQVVKFDEEVVKEILRLRDAGVNIEPRFPGGRTNPFE